MGSFNKVAFDLVDLDAVAADIVALLTNSQPEWYVLVFLMPGICDCVNIIPFHSHALMRAGRQTMATTAP